MFALEAGEDWGGMNNLFPHFHTFTFLHFSAEAGGDRTGMKRWRDQSLVQFLHSPLLIQVNLKLWLKYYVSFQTVVKQWIWFQNFISISFGISGLHLLAFIAGTYWDYGASCESKYLLNFSGGSSPLPLSLSFCNNSTNLRQTADQNCFRTTCLTNFEQQKSTSQRRSRWNKTVLFLWFLALLLLFEMFLWT